MNKTDELLVEVLCVCRSKGTNNHSAWSDLRAKIKEHLEGSTMPDYIERLKLEKHRAITQMRRAEGREQVLKDQIGEYKRRESSIAKIVSSRVKTKQ